MSLNQIGTLSNLSFSTAGSILPTPVTTNISLTALKVAYVGSSTAYANVQSSKMSLWYLATCASGVNSNVAPGSAPFNPSRTIGSPSYAGWVYSGPASPWNPASISEFQRAANTRPTVTCTRTDTGDSQKFTLSLLGSWIDDTGGAVTPSPPGAMSEFYLWIVGPGVNFINQQWVTQLAGTPLVYPNCIPGNYTVYVQDVLGAGNQFEMFTSFTYP